MKKENVPKKKEHKSWTGKASIQKSKFWTNAKGKKGLTSKNTKLEETCIGRIIVKEILYPYSSTTIWGGMHNYVQGLNPKDIWEDNQDL
jgi:hypothetical protein